jgi:hypothetical protein
MRHLLRLLPGGWREDLRHDNDGERDLLPGHGRLLWDGLLPDRSDVLQRDMLPDRSGVLQRELLSRRSVLQRELLQRGPDLPGWAVWDTSLCEPCPTHRHLQRLQSHVRLPGGPFLLPGHRGWRELVRML